MGVLVKQIATLSSRRVKENEQTQEVIFRPQCKKVHGFKVHHGNSISMLTQYISTFRVLNIVYTVPVSKMQCA